MPGLRVRLFGRTAIEVNGRAIALTPITADVLSRLVAAEDALVTVDEIHRDVWPGQGPVDREARTKVQRRIMDIRRAVDPDHPGEQSAVVVTERGGTSGYRLAIPRGDVDVFEFIDLVTEARTAALADKIAKLQRAAGLWRGEPLADVARHPWAARLVRQLNDLHKVARHDLMEALAQAGREDEALRMGELLFWDDPEDSGMAESVEALRAQVRVSRRKKLFRENYHASRTSITVMAGDLFSQEDANLVAGFCDTFDTDTDDDIVISRTSAQGELLHRAYGGDRPQLDRDLKAALRVVPKASVEPRLAKKRGKLTRYPPGTVATLRHAGRRVFAVAYSRMGNDLVARSSLDLLRASLDNLWEAVYLNGQLKPVAMPLVGSSLSRIHEAIPDDLLALIAGSFLASVRQPLLCPELRIVVPEAVFDTLRIAEILRSAAVDLEPQPA